MVCRLLASASITWLIAASLTAQTEFRLTHRVWLADPGLSGDEVTQLRAVGVDGAVVPVGQAAIAKGGTRLVLRSLPDLKELAGWAVLPMVWVEGSGDDAGDAATFLSQFSVVASMFPGGGGVVLAAKQFWPGLPRFASALAKNLGKQVELVLPARVVAEQAPPGGWNGVTAVAVAFGNAGALGFTSSTLHDDLTALEALDDRGLTYRVVVVVSSRATPEPASGQVGLAALASASVADYRPGQRGDQYVLRAPLNWGGTILGTGATIELELEDTARFDRDLGLLLRPVRFGLTGWDTAMLPPREPALGMSREAFLDYFGGGSPVPRPEVVAEWVGPSTLRVAINNPSPHGSAAATQGNWIDLTYPGGMVGDAELGDFRGIDYGHASAGTLRRTGAGEATALRLFLTCVAPSSHQGGALIRFVARPDELRTRWGVRLSDGREISSSFALLTPSRGR